MNERLVYGWRKILENITGQLGINPIFSQVMTITTSDIFQYFCQPCNNYGHKYVFHKITHEYYYHTIFNCNIKIILYLRQIPQDTQNQI